MCDCVFVHACLDSRVHSYNYYLRLKCPCLCVITIHACLHSCVRACICMFIGTYACAHASLYVYALVRTHCICACIRMYSYITRIQQAVNVYRFVCHLCYALTPCGRPKADTLFLRELAFIRMHEFPLIIIAVTKSALFKMPTRRQLSHVIINDVDAMVRNQGIVALDAVNRRKLYRVYNLVA